VEGWIDIVDGSSLETLFNELSGAVDTTWVQILQEFHSAAWTEAESHETISVGINWLEGSSSVLPIFATVMEGKYILSASRGIAQQTPSGIVVPLTFIRDFSPTQEVRSFFIDGENSEIFLVQWFSGGVDNIVITDYFGVIKRTLNSPEVGFAMRWITVTSTELIAFAHNGTGTNKIYFFPRTASGSTLPANTIAGGNTTLDGPAVIGKIVAKEFENRLYVLSVQSVKVFALNAYGDVAPAFPSTLVRNSGGNEDRPVFDIIGSFSLPNPELKVLNREQFIGEPIRFAFGGTRFIPVTPSGSPWGFFDATEGHIMDSSLKGSIISGRLYFYSRFINIPLGIKHGFSSYGRDLGGFVNDEDDPSPCAEPTILPDNVTAVLDMRFDDSTDSLFILHTITGGVTVLSIYG
jgi:hypothetical protein